MRRPKKIKRLTREHRQKQMLKVAKGSINSDPPLQSPLKRLCKVIPIL